MKQILLLLLFINVSIFSFGQLKQRGQLSGQVTDAKTGAPLAGASVMISDSKIGTSTDSLGNYLIANTPIGHTTIEISFFGYKTLVEHIDVSGNEIHNFQMTSTILVNEGVTVTAVGSATSIRKAPIPISRVNKTELLATPSTNIIDAISRQPGVNQLSTGPAVSKPIIRGLGYNRLVVVNDGLRQEGQQWGDEHGIEIDENSVSRVEIVKGPASLIYGSDALAGVINFITTTPAPNNTIKGSVLSSYMTNNKQRSLFANLGGNQNGFNWNMWGDYKAAADYSNKYDGRVYNSKYNEGNVGGYIGYNGGWGFSHLILSNFNQHLGLIEGARDSSGAFVRDLPGGITGNPSEADFNSTDPQVPYQHVQHFKIISDNSFKAGTGKLTLNVGWQRNQRKEFGNADLPQLASLYFDLHTINYNVGYHFDDKNGWATSVGVGGMYQTNQNRGFEVLIPEYNLFDLGAFVYTEKTIGKSSLSGGIRYDTRDLTSKEFKEGSVVKFDQFHKTFYNMSGSLGLSYAAGENFVIKANIAHGFRAPSIPELASNGAHEGTNRYEYGNTSLVSEKSWQGDIGTEWNSEHVMLNASAFYNHIDNFIYYSKLSNGRGGDSLVTADNTLIPAYKFNQSSANLSGFEAVLDIHPHPWDWLHWENTFSYVRGKFAQPVDGNSNVPSIPASRLRSELRAVLLKTGKQIRNLDIYVEADNTFAQDKPFTAYGTETPTPGYSLINAGITANVQKHNTTLFSIYLVGENLSDVAYQSHLSRLKYTDINLSTGRMGVWNMGRNFMIKLNIPLSFNTK